MSRQPEAMGPTPTQIVPPPQVVAGAGSAPPVVAAPQVVKDAGPGFSALFVVQQVRYPSRIFDVNKPSIILGRGATVDLNFRINRLAASMLVWIIKMVILFLRTWEVPTGPWSKKKYKSTQLKAQRCGSYW